jgi:hypothetical protein
MQKALIIFVAAGSLIAGIFVWLHRPGPCAAIMEQTTQKLNLSLDVIKAKGALVIGGEKVQNVSENARNVGEHLTACCDAQHSDHPLPPDQYLACVNGARNYETKIVQITNIIKEADQAKQQGNAQLAEQKAEEARAAVEASSLIVRDLGQFVTISQTARPAPAIENAKPWEEAKVVIKLKNGKSVTTDTKQISTDSYCGGSALSLDYGQSIPFKNMQSFSVADDKPTIEIIVLNGEHLTGGVDSLCHIYAANEFGDFKTSIGNIERVDFGR